MKTQVNGIEITPKMAEIFEEWYANSASWDDTVPYFHVRNLCKVQDFLCSIINDNIPDIENLIFTVVSIKKDLEKFIPEKDEQD